MPNGVWLLRSVHTASPQARIGDLFPRHNLAVPSPLGVHSKRCFQHFGRRHNRIVQGAVAVSPVLSGCPSMKSASFLAMNLRALAVCMTCVAWSGRTPLSRLASPPPLRAAPEAASGIREFECRPCRSFRCASLRSVALCKWQGRRRRLTDKISNAFVHYPTVNNPRRGSCCCIC